MKDMSEIRNPKLEIRKDSDGLARTNSITASVLCGTGLKPQFDLFRPNCLQSVRIFRCEDAQAVVKQTLLEAIQP